MDSLIIGLAFTAVIGGLIGMTRGRVVGGAILGGLLGPIGWLLVLVGKDQRKKCPSCRAVIDPEARICPHCRSVIDPIETHLRFQREEAARANSRRAEFMDDWWYLDENGTVQGPYTMDQLKQLYHNQAILLSTQVNRNGSQEWIEMGGLI